MAVPKPKHSEPDTATKSGFARLLGVSPARVTQWIQAGIIGPEAFKGSGRNALLKVEIAKEQVRARRDIGQAVSNGSKTRLDTVPAPIGKPSANDELDAALRSSRLFLLQSANRKALEEEASRKGRYMMTEDAKAEAARVEAAVLEVFEEAIPRLAAAVADNFDVSQAETEKMIEDQFRAVREQTVNRRRLVS